MLFSHVLVPPLSSLVCACYARIKTAHKLGYLCIYWRNILCGSLLDKRCLCVPKLT